MTAEQNVKKQENNQRHGQVLVDGWKVTQEALKNRDIFSPWPVIRMLLACPPPAPPYPVVLEHLGHTLLLQECHPMNGAADGAASCGRTEKQQCEAALLKAVWECGAEGASFCTMLSRSNLLERAFNATDTLR